MKLLYDCTELSYFDENSGHRAGVFQVALNLYKELKKLGVDITFVCDYKRYYFLKKQHIFKNEKLLKENSILNKFIGKILYYTDKFPIRIKYVFLILARFYDKYLYLINKKNVQQLKDYDAYFSPFTPPSKEIETSNIKKFRILHDVIPIIENGMPKSPRDWYYKIYSTINKNDFYIANSNYTRQDILKYFSFIKDENIKTIYLGTDEKFKPTKTEAKQKYIFSLCTLGKRKNLLFAIKNFFKFIESNNITDLKFVLAGGTWKKFEKELYDGVGKFDKTKIEFLGYVNDEELPTLYSNAIMFVFPSLYEGFGLPVLEAMQCGCPVIASNTSSLPEVIGDAGIQINPTSDEEMISAYEKMYFYNNFRQLCIKKGLERAKQFSWEKCASELFEFIKTNCV